MTRSELIDVLATEFPGLTQKDLRRTVESIFGAISFTLENGDRVEIRGFGSFQSKLHDAKKGRNPRTGETVEVKAKRHVRFKASKLLLRKMNMKSSTA
jgi:integration host factor subunit beta